MRNQTYWIIAAVVLVLVVVVVLYNTFRPGGEAPTETTAPPATTEQPAQPAPAQ
jgi:hypothetical protein